MRWALWKIGPELHSQHVAAGLTQNYLLWVIDTGYGFRGTAQDTEPGTRNCERLLPFRKIRPYRRGLPRVEVLFQHIELGARSLERRLAEE